MSIIFVYQKIILKIYVNYDKIKTDIQEDFHKILLKIQMDFEKMGAEIQDDLVKPLII